MKTIMIKNKTKAVKLLTILVDEISLIDYSNILSALCKQFFIFILIRRATYEKLSWFALILWMTWSS